MKRIIVLLLVCGVIATIISCGDKTDSNDTTLENSNEIIETISSKEVTSTKKGKEQKAKKTKQTKEAKQSNQSKKTTDSKENNASQSSDGMRPEFKEAMDSYEAFYDEYCEFMKQYEENPTDLKLLAKYADMMKKLADMDKKFQDWKSNDLNDKELQYYMEVNSRITQKLVDIVA